MLTQDDLRIATLGTPQFTSPLRQRAGIVFVGPERRIRLHQHLGPQVPEDELELSFEEAGPRHEIFFDPSATSAAIVTCGGLCPGLNNVIRSVFLELHHAYGVKDVVGFRGGYGGLDPARAYDLDLAKALLQEDA